MKKFLFLLIPFFASSCASDSGIINSGENQFFIAKQAATGFPGTGGIKADALKSAESFCQEQGKKLNIVLLDENEGPYVLGKYPRVELTFSCI